MSDRAIAHAVPALKNVAAPTTVYRHNSHADIIVSRLLLTDTIVLNLNGQSGPSF